MLRSVPFVAFVLAALLAAGCHGGPRVLSPDEVRARFVASEARQAAYEDGRAALARSLADRLETRGDATLDVLVLSGGGQHGAFGAGFLNGWADNPRVPMPTFDVVTGVSTGALQAPMAFLGTREALAELADLYRNPDRIMPRLNVLGVVVGTGGLFDVSRLSATLGEALTPERMDALHAGFADGRRLLVGTTDLDLGRGRVWNVAAEAPPTEAGAARLRRLLLASSAIPGAFPPVQIDGRWHTDGGVTSNLLGADLLLLRALADERAARGHTRPATVRLWAIVNVWLTPPAVDLNPRRVDEIGQRANGLMFALAQQHALTRMWEVAEAVNAGAAGPALRVEFRYAAVPDRWASERGATELFDAAYMNRLQDYATERGRSAGAWQTGPPGPFE